MKHVSLAGLCLVIWLMGCRSSHQTTLTPSPVHNLVAKIQADMPTVELDRIFGGKSEMGPWSGGTGYLWWALPSGGAVTVSCYSRDGLKTIFVHPDVTVYFQETVGKESKRIR